MRKILIASCIFFLLFFYGLILSQTQVKVIDEALEPGNYPGFYDYRGTANVHTTRNLGSGSPAHVIRSAQDAGLDHIFITDLNAFNAAPISEGYHQKLLVMSGAEYSYLESRLLVYNIQGDHALESLGQAQVFLADRLSQSGRDAAQDFIVLAHPSKPGFSWTGAYPSGLDGIEILNLKSIWQHAWNSSKISFFWSAVVYPFNPQLALLRLYQDPKAELSLWDELSARQRTIGVAGSDASARTGSIGDFYLRFPAYQTSFRLLSNHILLRTELTGEFNGDRRKIFDAYSNGRFYMSLDVLGNPKGFVTFIQDDDKIHEMGSRMKWKPGIKIKARLPAKPKVPFEIAFIKDGQHVMSSNSVETEYEVHGRGVYRVIVRVFPVLTLPDGQRWLTWIYSNPFYLE